MTAEKLWARLPEWIRGHQLATIPDPEDTEEDDYSGAHVESDDIENAHIILSVDPATRLHRPVLDIDFPVHIEPSSTPGHFHLYLDKPMRWTKYRILLSALAAAGVIEENYAKVSDAREYTSVRLPWIKKGQA